MSQTGTVFTACRITSQFDITPEMLLSDRALWDAFNARYEYFVRASVTSSVAAARAAMLADAASMAMLGEAGLDAQLRAVEHCVRAKSSIDFAAQLIPYYQQIVAMVHRYRVRIFTLMRPVDQHRKQALESAGDVCAVCLDKHAEGRSVDLPCGHAFHMDCLTAWVWSRAHPTCPCCRGPAVL